MTSWGFGKQGNKRYTVDEKKRRSIKYGTKLMGKKRKIGRGLVLTGKQECLQG